MQIVYLGFVGTSQIEAEAASQLIRLERFCNSIAGCHLAVEAIRVTPDGCRNGAYAGEAPTPLFDARLDLIMRDGELVPVRQWIHVKRDYVSRPIVSRTAVLCRPTEA
ncbi:hypothetical protein [Paraburkholderia phytofirmans]|uniref:hypothetical protein n=1 Tax=Paraburkholderia phytofirmans TaxID=261302 RepID=UPI0038B6F70B